MINGMCLMMALVSHLAPLVKETVQPLASLLAISNNFFKKVGQGEKSQTLKNVPIFPTREEKKVLVSTPIKPLIC